MEITWKKRIRKSETIICSEKALMLFKDYWGILLIFSITDVPLILPTTSNSSIKSIIERKKRDITIRSVELLNDKALSHTIALTHQKLEQMHWKLLKHPPYIPSLSPCASIFLAIWNKHWEIIISPSVSILDNFVFDSPRRYSWT